MLQLLDYEQEGTTPQQVHQAFNNEMGVNMWATPWTDADPVDTRIPGAPAWWGDDEEASQSFLAAYAPGLV
jgi:hypothetical protein